MLDLDGIVVIGGDDSNTNACLLAESFRYVQLMAEINEIIAHDVIDQGGSWKKKLRSQSCELFEILPKAIREQLLLERDPHGNVLVQIDY
ncbi:putative diphosphate--fructose-6-phosphate 1-phosphotransferase [Helianthus anomalus]